MISPETLINVTKFLYFLKKLETKNIYIYFHDTRNTGTKGREKWKEKEEERRGENEVGQVAKGPITGTIY